MPCSGNLIGIFHSILQDKEFSILGSQTKTHIESENSFVYADAIIFPLPIKKLDYQNNAITNPNVIFEIVSKTTIARDKGDKFRLCRQIENLEYYIIIEQDKVEVSIYKRKNKADNNKWLVYIFESLDMLCPCNLSETETINIKISDIYLDVEFE